MVTTVVRAGGFPDRPIKFINGFGAGGPTDIVGRLLADKLSDDLGQNVIVQNESGASGNIATQDVAAGAADGYTYLVGASPLAANETLFPDFPVKFGQNIIAVAGIGATDNVLVVRPSLNVHTFAEFVHLARSKPNAISYATVGVGSPSHLAGVALDLRAGTEMLAVNYRGPGDALKDLLSGNVDARFASIPSVLGAIQDGRLMALATTGPERTSWLPSVPTIAESGFTGYDVRLWIGIFARSGVPMERLRCIEEAITHATASKEFAIALQLAGINRMSMSRDEFTGFVTADIARARTQIGVFKTDDR
jgi:tripartite-type tricarboxylate transporter receptor subunit TctC